MANSTGTNGFSNINFTEGSTLYGDKGNNCFSVSNLSNNNHVIGVLPLPCATKPCALRNNYWNSSPSMNITCNGNQVSVNTSPTIDCPPINWEDGIEAGYEVHDLGNGTYDSVLVTSPPSGSSQSSVYFAENEDLMFYSKAVKYRRQGNYTDAIGNIKYLINSHDSSIYLLSALDELFLSVRSTDTTNSQTNTNIIFGGPKQYLTDKMNQYNQKPAFVEKAYFYYLMCLIKTKNYQEAIAGYENIMGTHPSALARLTASWDRAAAILLMNGGSGGGESNEYETIENNETLYDKDPAHKIAFDSFEKRRKEYTADRDDNNSNSGKKRDKYDNQSVENRITKFNPANRNEFTAKVNEDIRILMGLNKESEFVNNSMPRQFELHQNYPNPFNPVTTIKYDLPNNVKVTIRIYDLLGRELVTLLNNEYKAAGIYEVKWNASNYASGVYFYRIEAGNFVQSKKMVLIK